MKYTIGQAAKVTGRSKSLISKAIKDGRLSATRTGMTPTSPMEIDASELFRVFSKADIQQNEPEQQMTTLPLATALEIAKVQKEYQDKRISDLEEQLKETKDRAEEYRERAEEYRLELKSAETKLIGVLEARHQPNESTTKPDENQFTIRQHPTLILSQEDRVYDDV